MTEKSSKTPPAPVVAKPNTPVAASAAPVKAPVSNPTPNLAPIAAKVADAPMAKRPPTPEPAAVVAKPKPVIAKAFPVPVKPKPAITAKAAAPKEGKSPMTETITTMTNEATNRAQAAFGDINGRAKAAMEKSGKLFEQMNDFSKGNIEAVVESTKLAAKGVETMGQHAAETARKNYETATSAMKSFASVKSPTELFQLQSEFARSSFDTLVADASKNAEAMLKLMGEVFQPISNRFAVAAEKIKTVA